MEELVSVIIPTYKRNKNLENAIQSVLKQTYKNFEIIIVDDNNPDTEYRKANEELMKKYENNEKVIYVKHEKNRNGAAARNTGIFLSKGKYIAFLDDDDEFLENKLERQVEFLNQYKEFNCVSCQIYKRGSIVKQKINQKTLIRDILSLKVSPITSTLLFREKSIKDINGFDENYRRHQDVELMVRYLQKNKLGYIEEPLIIMGVNKGENELKGEELNELKRQFLMKFMPIIDELDKKQKGTKRKIICSHYVGLAINHIKHKNYKLLKLILKRAYTTYPITFTIKFVKSIYKRAILHIKWRKFYEKN